MLRPLWDFIFLSSPIDGECNALLDILLLQQPLPEPFKVFSNPMKIPQWILPLITERKEFSSLLYAFLHTNSNALLAEYLLTEHSAVLSPSPVHPLHLINVHLENLSESSVILVLLPELTTKFLFCALLALARFPLGRASLNPQ
jgi:hypothetical protein